MKEQNKYVSRVTRNLLWIFVVVSFVVRSVWLLIDHHLHPEKFAASAHPWYWRIVIPGAILLAAFVLWKVVIAVLNKRKK